MAKLELRVLVLVGLVIRCPDAGAGEQGGDIVLASDAPKPLTPEESLKLFQIPRGFRMELVAAEPLLADPVAMAFDARGRLLVCEIHGYNLEGYYDVLELNRTGVLDRAVRRILANPEAVKRAEKEQYGTVKFLEDTDGDGRMDRASVLADRLPPCYGVAPARGGVIVLCAPDILFLADRDGDGKAEIRETLFTGFGVGELWTRINNPRRGLDNWIYAVCGANSSGRIRGPHLERDVQLGSVCFRFKADGSALEPVNGRTSGFGQAMNDWGDRFLCTNQQHALYVTPLPHRYLVRNPYHAAPNSTVNISSYGHPARVYPTSQPDRWRAARAEDPAWVRFYGVAEATANGFFTAASGQAIYRADQFPSEYLGNHFSVDNAQNLVHRCVLEPRGATYVARRPRKEERREFLTSTEQWFRPVNLAVGPDGALYIVDMYRDIIEDYSAIPRYLQQLYIKSLIAGLNRGRIWRLAAEGAAKPEKFDLSKSSTPELIQKLAHRNSWWRTTAQRLLVERGDRSQVGLLEDLSRKGKTPQARLHALHALDGLDALSPAVVDDLLGDPHFAVRMHALRLAERWLDERPPLLNRILAMVEDRHARVRLQVALTLGQSRSEQALQALVRLAARHGDEQWMPAAILSSLGESADEFLAAVLAGSDPASRAKSLIPSLASMIGARRGDEEIGGILELLGTWEDRSSTSQVISCLEGLVEGLGRGSPRELKSRRGINGLRRLLLHGDFQVRRLAMRLAGLIKLHQGQEMKRALAFARNAALDDSKTLEQRLAAVDLLTGAPFNDLAPVARDLLDPRQPLDLQAAAVRVLSSAGDPAVGPLLLAGFKTYSPRIRSTVMQAVFSRQNRLPALLGAMEEESVPVSSLDTLRRRQLTGSSDPEVAGRAKKLLAGAGTLQARQEVLNRYQKALSLKRDARRGKEVFQEQCVKCHRLAGEGQEVGPDLSAARTRADETLISDILDPSNQITVGYESYTVATGDGRIFTGVLAAETATSITLRREEGAEDTILRRDLEEMESASLSMMPEDMEKVVSPQDVADLIGYLRQVLGPLEPASLTLFDEDPAWIELLHEGQGTVRMDSREPFSGKVSLVVTPPQRYSSRIPGWEYRIAENPGPGEFRYLQFAWKQKGGQGIMLELAADGKWPPADRAVFRYYSGKNTTGWSAVRISSRLPEQWVVVTRDLWRDFGPFLLTGMAPTAMGGEAHFDRIELLRSLDP